MSLDIILAIAFPLGGAITLGVVWRRARKRHVSQPLRRKRSPS